MPSLTTRPVSAHSDTSLRPPASSSIAPVMMFSRRTQSLVTFTQQFYKLDSDKKNVVSLPPPTQMAAYLDPTDRQWSENRPLGWIQPNQAADHTPQAAVRILQWSQRFGSFGSLVLWSPGNQTRRRTIHSSTSHTGSCYVDYKKPLPWYNPVRYQWCQFAVNKWLVHQWFILKVRRPRVFTQYISSCNASSPIKIVGRN